jgi:hypothetical protein
VRHNERVFLETRHIERVTDSTIGVGAAPALALHDAHPMNRTPQPRREGGHLRSLSPRELERASGGVFWQGRAESSRIEYQLPDGSGYCVLGDLRRLV